MNVMKKKIGLIVGAALASCVLGLGIYHSSATGSSPEMTENDIKDMNTNQYPGDINNIEKQKDGGAYEVKLENKTKGYTLKVDASTGEILKIDEDTIAKADASDKDQNKESNENKADTKKDDEKEKSSKSDDKAGKKEHTEGDAEDTGK